ncbi:PREDICTED: high affinity immunoglobulin alpha and immunoglobulin mu Fc receptor isoform X1 [Hipposideros armiger]|uniref:high affinity immunoglobulin alpha and immunoglobulin mu Fc receptor isoform X1 n=2 Tax=Hipposideros armiger TaxID=186990 RepID=UPI00093CF722|nr:PREDICTED: high affinity immunoglobulin alpha and immunoglobulin mu Fc receptor isoform X1 [Hipposideros armiger]
MEGEALAKPGERKVVNQRAGWKMPVLFILCLLQAANALKGPRMVSGEPGDTVAIQCHYTPSPINKHQRKYWCRLSPWTGLCRTIVSTNHYTHLHYRDRVALADFPRSGLFVVRLSQLSPDDVGSYRCGIGDRNNMLFFSMRLNVSAGPPSTISRVTPAAGELLRRAFRMASSAANSWTPGTTQTTERQGTGWDRVAPTPETSKRTASAKGRQTPGTTGAVAAGTFSQVETSTWATVPTPESVASTTRDVSNTTEGVWIEGTKSSVANRSTASEEGREVTTAEADRPREELERAKVALDADWTVIGTIRPSTLVSEKRVWTTLQETRLVSKPQALGSAEGTTSAVGMWVLGPTSIDMASAEGSTEGDLDTPAGYSDTQATSSQDPAAGPLRLPGKGSSMKSAPPEKKHLSRILTPVSAVLFPLVALVLLQRKLRRRKTSQETEKAAGVTLIQMTHFQPDPRPRVTRKTLQDDSPPIQATMTVPERDAEP